MQRFKIKIQMVTPYMQHRMDDQKLADWEKSRGKIIENEDSNKEDKTVAMYHSYINDEGEYYMPAVHLKRCFVNGGAMVKGKVGNSTRSLKNVVAGQFFVEPSQIIIPEFDEIDKRSGVNQNNKARIIIIRPKWNNLSVTFQLNVDNDEFLVDNIKKIVEYGGKFVGIGSFRPQNNGEFGRFEVKTFKKLK